MLVPGYFTVFPSQYSGFINGKCVVCGIEMRLCSLMRTTRSLDSFMMSQFYPCLLGYEAQPRITELTGFYDLYIQDLYQA